MTNQINNNIPPIHVPINQAPAQGWMVHPSLLPPAIVPPAMLAAYRKSLTSKGSPAPKESQVPSE